MIGEIYDVRLIDEAEEDLDSIYNYYAFKRHEPRLGRKIYNQIMEKLESLEELPFRYPVYQVEPWKSMGVRQVFAGKYCGFYFVRENQVLVFRIMYGGMDIDAALSETEFDDFD